MAMEEDDSGRRQRRWMMTAREIKRRITRGNEESRRQTTKALGQLSREHKTKIKKSSLRKKTFLSNTVCTVGVFAPAENQLRILLLDLSVLFYQSFGDKKNEP